MENQYIFLLTNLIRNADQDRRIVVKGFDINRRHFFLVLVAFPAVALITAVFWPLLGQYALLIVPTLYALLFYLVESRTQVGLQLRRYQALIDSKVSPTGKFLLCGAEVNPGMSVERKILTASVPVAKPVDDVDVHGMWTDDEGLFSMPAARH